MLAQLLALCILPSPWTAIVLALPSPYHVSPCAELSEAIQTKGRLDGIPGYLARDCLRTIPFYKKESLQLGYEIKKYLQFHSTLDELKDPPITYVSRPVSLDRTLFDILQTASDKPYASQTDFDLEISNALGTARDGHLQYQPCSLGLFEFYQEISLVSISEEGLQTPDVYTYSDYLLMSTDSHHVSPIVKIGDRYVLEYITDIPGFHDPDARYNTLFSNPTQDLTRRTSFKPKYERYPGASILVEYANGTVDEVPTFAALGPAFAEYSGSISGGMDSSSMIFESGAQLFESLCMHQTTQPPSNHRSSGLAQTPMTLKLAQGHTRRPADQDDENLPSGPFHPLSIHSDVAVLSVPSFDVSSVSSSSPNDQMKHFLATAQDSIQQARDAGKTKLIIDLSDNVGESNVLAHGLYRLLFPGPNEEVYSSTRFRKHPAIALIGKAVSNSHEPCMESPLTAVCAAASTSPNQTTNMSTWKTLYSNAPHFSSAHSISNYTHLLQHLLPPSTNLTAPFNPQNILLLTNGICASACAAFTALLRNHADPAHRARTIALGGRPKHGPMQLVGGSKGAHRLSFAAIDTLVTAARKAVAAGTSGLTRREAQELMGLDARIPAGLATLNMRVLGGSVGFASAYDVASVTHGGMQTPRQFLYEAADCRLFYTHEMLGDPVRLWERVAWSAWGSEDGGMRDCVKGSMGAPGSLAAGGVQGLEEMYMTTSVRDGPFI